MRASDIAYAITERTGGKKTYVTFDIDCLDPAFAPGTGTPVSGRAKLGEDPVGAAAAHQVDIVGADVVEVAPPYDHADITAIAGSAVAMYYLGLLAERRCGRTTSHLKSTGSQADSGNACKSLKPLISGGTTGMRPKIFIDGEHGTTGLQIRTRLAARDDIELISVPAERRKDAAARAEFLNAADVAILCLPDDAAQGERRADRQ